MSTIDMIEKTANRAELVYLLKGTEGQRQALDEENRKALRMIQEVTDGALDDAGLIEAVAILISQRDNARNEAEYWRNMQNND